MSGIRRSGKSERAKAQENLIRAKAYRFLAIGLLVLGFIVMIRLYAGFAEGGVPDFRARPFMLLILFAPFLPALVFSILSERNSTALKKRLYAGHAGDGKVKGDKTSR